MRVPQVCLEAPEGFFTMGISIHKALTPDGKGILHAHEYFGLTISTEN